MPKIKEVFTMLVRYYLSEEDYLDNKVNFGYMFGGNHDNTIILLRDSRTMEELEIPSYLVIL